MEKKIEEEIVKLWNKNLPKHLERFVSLSMYTLADISVPKGVNIDAKSKSVQSWGKW